LVSFIICSLISVFIFQFDLKPKWNTDKKGFWIGAVFLVSGYALLALMSFDIRPPSFVYPFAFIAGLFLQGGLMG